MAIVACVVLIDTQDLRLLDYREGLMGTASGVAALRDAVIENLPSLTRVVAIMDEEPCQIMTAIHEQVMAELGGASISAPKDYVSPADRKH